MTHGTEQCRFEKAEETIFEKTVQKQAEMRNNLGKRNTFWTLFLIKMLTFLMLWLLGNLWRLRAPAVHGVSS